MTLREEKILEFFNSVNSAILIRDYIKDDPGFSKTTQTGYGISLSTAENILKTRNLKPKKVFSSIGQIDSVKGVGPITLHNILFSFPENTSYSSPVESISKQEDWHLAVLENSWANYPDGWNPAGYFMDNMGIVHLRGIVIKGSFLSDIFSLPFPYRPPNSELFVVPTGDYTSSGQIVVYWNGKVRSLIPNPLRVSLDGITFRAINT